MSMLNIVENIPIIFTKIAYSTKIINFVGKVNRIFLEFLVTISMHVAKMSLFLVKVSKDISIKMVAEVIFCLSKTF